MTHRLAMNCPLARIGKLWPMVLPVVRAQIPAANSTLCRNFNRRTAVQRHRTRPAKPVRKIGSVGTDCPSQPRLAAAALRMEIVR